jgi:hypothetical protein
MRFGVHRGLLSVARPYTSHLTNFICISSFAGRAVEDDLGCSRGDPKKIKTLCHSKMKEGWCYFDLRLISSTSSVARASFKPVVVRITHPQTYNPCVL